jgi:transcriptional regulator
MARSGPPELLQGTLDMMILKTLSFAPNHGYGVARRIRQASGDVLEIEEGSLYPALHRLERRGFLTAEWQRSESNRRAKFYRLTPRGRAQLEADTSRWKQMAAAVGKVMGAAPRATADPDGGVAG